MKKTVSKFVINQNTSSISADSIENTMLLFEMGDYREAMQGCLKFVGTGDIRILLALTEMYQFGLAGELDLDKAEYYLSIAAKSDTESCYRMAQWLEKGFNGTADPSAAIDYYLHAAECGHSKALLHVGECYASGRLLECNPFKAFRCFKRIVDKNEKSDESTRAEVKLALCCLNGIGTQIDYSRALFYMSQAARHQSEEAIYELSMMYSSGRGVTQDSRKAFHLMNEAAALNYAPAQYQLGVMYEKALGTIENLERAFNWYHMAYEFNYLPAYAKMAGFLLEGTITGRDYQKAKEIAEKGAAHSDGECYCVLYTIYSKGYGVRADKTKAMDYLNKAVIEGSTNAAKIMGDLYAEGNNDLISRDLKEAEKWYTRAAEENSIPAMKGLVNIYLSSDTAIRNTEKAKNWLKTLAENFGDADSYYRLGKFEEDGVFGEPDRDRVQFNYTEAARRGHTEAKFNLARLYHDGKLLEKDDHVAYYYAYSLGGKLKNIQYNALLMSIENNLSEEEKSEIRNTVIMETMSSASSKMRY
jgi:TPR repeat protein